MVSMSQEMAFALRGLSEQEPERCTAYDHWHRPNKHVSKSVRQVDRH